MLVVGDHEEDQGESEGGGEAGLVAHLCAEYSIFGSQWRDISEAAHDSRGPFGDGDAQTLTDQHEHSRD